MFSWKLGQGAGIRYIYKLKGRYCVSWKVDRGYINKLEGLLNCQHFHLTFDGSLTVASVK